MLFYFSLGILILIFGASVFNRRFFNKHKHLSFVAFYFSLAVIFILLFYQSYQQYQFWLENETAKYFLPPYQNINYFIFFIFARFFAPYLISLAVAFLFLFSAKRLNKKYGERFFEPEEPYLGALALFLTAWPGALFYFIGLILIYLIIQIFIMFYYKFFVRVSPREVRVGLRYLWIPVGIFVILIEKWLQILPLWQMLKL
jgi:hypothetical protein